MTGIAATYKVLMDFDQDGFFCEGVLPTDPLNKIVGARQSGIGWAQGFAYEGFSSARAYGVHSDGVWTYTTTQLSTAPNAGIALNTIVFGAGRFDPAPPGAVDSIPVLALTTYTVRLWIKTVSGSNSVTFVATNQNLTTQGANTVVQTAGVWTERTITFTTDEQTTYMAFYAYQPATAGGQVFQTRGLMLVEGSVMPAIYNAGEVSNIYDDITPYMERMQWGYGIPLYSDVISPPSTLTLELNNLSGDWTPENASSPFYPLNRGSLIKVSAVFNAVEYTLFQGVSTSFKPTPGAKGKQTATITVGDPMAKAIQNEYTPDIQLNVRTDEVLEAAFDSGAVLYPYPGHNWLLGVPGASELSSTTVVFLQLLTNFEQGDSVFTFAGDITGQDQPVTVQRVLREYLYAELGGRLWWDAPTLQFKFYRRTHDARSTPTLTTINALELDEPPEYVWGDDLINHFTLSYFPRSIGAALSVLYAMGNLPLSLSAGSSRQIRARYSTPAAPDATTAALTTITPVAGVDYIANAAADGSGASKTANLAVYVVFHATGADITLTNSDAATIYITTFQLRGTPLTTFTRDSIIAQDGESQIRHGEYRRAIDMPALDSADLAQQYANYLLQRYKTPLGRFAAFSLWGNRSAADMLINLSTQIGDAFMVSDPVVMNAITDYIVTAVAHRVDARGSHWTRFTLEPLNRAIFWILDDAVLSLLDSTTKLGL